MLQVTWPRNRRLNYVLFIYLLYLPEIHIQQYVRTCGQKYRNGHFHIRQCFKNCRISIITPQLSSCAINPDVVYFPLHDQVLTFFFNARAEQIISNSFC